MHGVCCLNQFKFGVCWKLLLLLISEPNFCLGKLYKPEKKEEKMEKKKKVRREQKERAREFVSIGRRRENEEREREREFNFSMTEG